MSFRIIAGHDASELRATDDTIALSLATPVLRGASEECLFEGPLKLERRDDGLILGEADALRFFAYVMPRHGQLEAQARAAYRALLSAMADAAILRIWNYVPRINAFEAGIENYQAFCVGRAEAFAQHFSESGRDPSYPAGSAVGIKDDHLVIFGVAQKGVPSGQFFENPRQLPAYQYPICYSPKPPAFSRASSWTGASGRTVYISGTASVVGSETRFPLDLKPQLDTTQRLLEGIFAEVGNGTEGGLPEDWLEAANLRLYLRKPGDMATAEAWLREYFPLNVGNWRVVEADICRADLLAEIELSLHPGAQLPSANHPSYA